MGQEMVETAVAGQGSAGLAAAAGHGWWPPALALAVGLVVAFVLREAEVAAASGARRRPVLRAAPTASLCVPPAGLNPVLGPQDLLARHLAGRAPPLALN